MAKAEKVMVPVVTTVQEERISLELEVKEAQFLQDLMSHVSGCPKTSRRGIADNIGKSLRAVVPNSGWADRSDITNDSNIHCLAPDESRG